MAKEKTVDKRLVACLKLVTDADKKMQSLILKRKRALKKGNEMPGIPEDLQEEVLQALDGLYSFLKERVKGDVDGAFVASKSLPQTLLILRFTKEDIKKRRSFNTCRNLLKKYEPMQTVNLRIIPKSFHLSVRSFLSAVIELFQVRRGKRSKERMDPENRYHMLSVP